MKHTTEIEIKKWQSRLTSAIEDKEVAERKLMELGVLKEDELILYDYINDDDFIEIGNLDDAIKYVRKEYVEGDEIHPEFYGFDIYRRVAEVYPEIYDGVCTGIKAKYTTEPATAAPEGERGEKL